MARQDNPLDKVPGTRSRFRFPTSDTRYAFIGPAVALILALLVAFYVVGNWVGNPGNPREVQNTQPGAVKPDAPPQSPSSPK